MNGGDIYYGEKPWDGSRNLKDLMYPMSNDLDALVQDYKCKIIDIKDLENRQINSLSRDLRQLIYLLKHTYDNTLKDYCTNNPDLKNVSDDVSMAISSISHNKKIKKYIDSNLNKGGVNMESIFRNFENDAIQKGIGIGRAEGVIRLAANGFETRNISRLLDISNKDVEIIINEHKEEIAEIAKNIKLADS